jgi:hypothetical protein
MPQSCASLAPTATRTASDAATRTAAAQGEPRRFECPAAYRRFVEGQLALTIAEVKRDMDRRDDDHPGIRSLATVPDQLIDNSQGGTLSILVSVDAPTESPSTLVA